MIFNKHNIYIYNDLGNLILKLDENLNIKYLKLIFILYKV